MDPDEESGPGEQASAGRPPPVAEGWSPLIPGRRVFRPDPKAYRDEWRQKNIGFACALLGADRRVAEAVDELTGPAAETLRLYEAAQPHYEHMRRRETADNPSDLPPLSIEAQFAVAVAENARNGFLFAVGAVAHRLAAGDRLPIPHDIRAYYLYTQVLPSHMVEELAPTPITWAVSDDPGPYWPNEGISRGMNAITFAGSVSKKALLDYIDRFYDEAQAIAGAPRLPPGPLPDAARAFEVERLKAEGHKAVDICDRTGFAYTSEKNAQDHVRYWMDQAKALRAEYGIPS